MRTRTWLFAGLALLVAAACIRLGIWQLDRLSQRIQINEAVRAGLDLPPEALLRLIDQDPIPSYRRVSARGSFDHSHEILLSARSYDEQPGYHLVTPLLLLGRDEAILVDRGWIPYQAGSALDLSQYAETGEVTLEGVTKPPQQTPSLLRSGAQDAEAWRLEWTALDIGALERQYPYPLLPLYIAQTLASPEAQPPIPQPEIDLSRGPHLAYAIQWFGFAIVALVGGGYWLRRQLRGQGQVPQDDLGDRLG